MKFDLKSLFAYGAIYDENDKRGLVLKQTSSRWDVWKPRILVLKLNTLFYLDPEKVPTAVLFM